MPLDPRFASVQSRAVALALVLTTSTAPAATDSELPHAASDPVASEGTAEEAPPAQAGQRVRLRAPAYRPGRFVAVVRWLDDEKIAVNMEIPLTERRKSRHDMAIPFTAVRSLEVSHGRNLRWKRVWIGAAIGLLAGAALSALERTPGPGAADSASVRANIVLGLGIGTATGAIPWEGWEEVPIPP
jgi:hypothetical protein